MKDNFFDWKAKGVTSWKKLLRIVFTHGWQKDINCRGISAMEIALKIMRLHKDELKEDERDFVKSLLR